MAIDIQVPKQPSEMIFCNECKGSCWVKNNNKATQAAAKKRFGIIPNLCVNESDGSIKCPYTK